MFAFDVTSFSICEAISMVEGDGVDFLESEEERVIKSLPFGSIGTGECICGEEMLGGGLEVFWDLTGFDCITAEFGAGGGVAVGVAVSYLLEFTLLLESTLFSFFGGSTG
jgi:hypothetical protein